MGKKILIFVLIGHMQTVQTQIRRHRMWRLISVFTVYLQNIILKVLAYLHLWRMLWPHIDLDLPFLLPPTPPQVKARCFLYKSYIHTPLYQTCNKKHINSNNHCFLYKSYIHSPLYQTWNNIDINSNYHCFLYKSYIHTPLYQTWNSIDINSNYHCFLYKSYIHTPLYQTWNNIDINSCMAGLVITLIVQLRLQHMSK